MSGRFLRFHYGSHFRSGFNAEQRLLIENRNRAWNTLAIATNTHIKRLEHDLVQCSPALASVQTRLCTDPSRQNKIAWRAVLNELRPKINAADPTLNKTIAAIVSSSGIWWQNRDSLYADFVRVLRTNKNYLNEIRLKQRDDCRGNFNYRFQKPVKMADLISGRLPVQITCEGKHAIIRMPVHADGAGQYRFGQWPFTWHRDLPMDCLVRGINVIGRMVGAEWRLSVSILIEEPITIRKFESKRRAGVDVGWRLGPTGLRVATAVIDNEFQDLSLSSKWIEGMDYVFEIDEKLTESGKQAWINMGFTSGFPGWMAAEHALKSHDGAGAEWLKNSFNLRRERRNKLARLERERLDIYRKFAAMLAQSCDIIHIEKLDLRRLLDNDSKQSPQRKQQQRYAAVSILHECVDHASQRTGVALQRVDAYETTTEHIACGFINKPTREQMIACKGCGVLYDQDSNAALNIAASIKYAKGKK